MKKSLLILLISFSLIPLEHSQDFNSSNLNSRIRIKNSESVLMMYQILKDTHEIFTINKLEYWAVAGTLLGTVRHQGFIPWDIDHDICIDEKEENLLISLSSTFESLGYFLYKKSFGYILAYKSEPSLHIDIILTNKKNDKIFYSCKALHNRFPHRENLPLYFEIKELYPLQLCTYGQFEIYIPVNPHPYLKYAYGEDYLTHAMSWNGSKEKIKILLEDEDKKPAQPIGPLKDNI